MIIRVEKDISVLVMMLLDQQRFQQAVSGLELGDHYISFTVKDLVLFTEFYEQTTQHPHRPQLVQMIESGEIQYS